MIERSLQLDANGSSMNSTRCAIRPTDLPTENRRWIRHPQSFPTPMEEPKKVLRAQYVGSAEVNQPTGMEVLNDAIDKLTSCTPPENWDLVNVAVAPSMISVNSTDKFVAHVFYCEPTSGPLCKTIEAACKLRYQKCLDAHPEGSGRYSADSQTPGKGIGATLKNLMSSFSLKKDKHSMLPVAWQKINLVKYNSNQHRKTTTTTTTTTTTYGRGPGVTIDDSKPIPANINYDANHAATDMVEDSGVKTLDSVMEESFGNWSDGQ
uniref:PID domain-containing protein n=1 Tax=Anopheles maculatus TaxID=74869 RepID=A0A182T6N4_9DIPT